MNLQRILDPDEMEMEMERAEEERVFYEWETRNIFMSSTGRPCTARVIRGTEDLPLGRALVWPLIGW